MKKSFLIWLIILMIGSTVVATESDTLIIKLESSDPGDNLKVADIDWPKDIDEQIKLVNAGQGEFFVEIYNDPTVWQVVNWLKKQPGTAILDSNQMNLTYDGALNTARYQNVVRLYKTQGLERLAFRYIADRGKESMIRVYYGENSSANDGCSDTTYVSRTDTVVIKSAVTDNSVWSLRFGGELTPVRHGRRVMVPVASLAMSKANYQLELTGGYYPGDLDQKFFAGSLTYFPGGGHLGWITRLIYASETIETLGAYIQQGYGPMTGLEVRNRYLSFHLTGGFQYFDRRDQDRRIEPSVNVGLNFKAITF